jgi:hypothetical protein
MALNVVASPFKTSMPARTLPRWSSLSSKYADAFAGLRLTGFTGDLTFVPKASGTTSEKKNTTCNAETGNCKLV